MNIAEQLKAFHTAVSADEYTGRVHYIVDVIALTQEASQAGVENQDWESETTRYDFADGSCLVICNNEATVYGSRS